MGVLARKCFVFCVTRLSFISIVITVNNQYVRGKGQTASTTYLHVDSSTDKEHYIYEVHVVRGQNRSVDGALLGV